MKTETEKSKCIYVALFASTEEETLGGLETPSYIK